MTERFLAAAVRMQGRLKEAYALLRLAKNTYPLGQNAYDLNTGGDWPPGGSSVILGSKTFLSLHRLKDVRPLLRSARRNSPSNRVRPWEKHPHAVFSIKQD